MVTIRKFNVADTTAYLAWLSVDSHRHRMAEAQIKGHLAGSRAILLALMGEQIVGSAQFIPTRMEPELGVGAMTCYLQGLEVHSEHRRRGIGRRLVLAAKEEGRAQGFGQISLMVEPENQAAIDLCLKLGFTPYKRSIDSWRADGYPVLWMTRELLDETSESIPIAVHT